MTAGKIEITDANNDEIILFSATFSLEELKDTQHWNEAHQTTLEKLYKLRNKGEQVDYSTIVNSRDILRELLRSTHGNDGDKPIEAVRSLDLIISQRSHWLTEPPRLETESPEDYLNRLDVTKELKRSYMNLGNPPSGRDS